MDLSKMVRGRRWIFSTEFECQWPMPNNIGNGGEEGRRRKGGGFRMIVRWWKGGNGVNVW
jgi:hypothetical protein